MGLFEASPEDSHSTIDFARSTDTVEMINGRLSIRVSDMRSPITLKGGLSDRNGWRVEVVRFHAKH